MVHCDMLQDLTRFGQFQFLVCTNKIQINIFVDCAIKFSLLAVAGSSKHQKFPSKQQASNPNACTSALEYFLCVFITKFFPFPFHDWYKKWIGTGHTVSPLHAQLIESMRRGEYLLPSLNFLVGIAHRRRNCCCCCYQGPISRKLQMTIFADKSVIKINLRLETTP